MAVCVPVGIVMSTVARPEPAIAPFGMAVEKLAEPLPVRAPRRFVPVDEVRAAPAERPAAPAAAAVAGAPRWSLWGDPDA